MKNQTWGNWTIKLDTFALFYRNPETHAWYEADLERMCDSAQILDWIYQIYSKTFISNSDKAFFVTAVMEIFGRGVASHGHDHPIDPKEIIIDSYNL